MSRFSVDLSGENAIVTGGGADIGRAVALVLASSGASVFVNDLNPDRAERVSNEINQLGGKAKGWQADVTNRFQAASLIEAARDTFGRISILINAAGVYKTGPINTLDEWDWRRILDVNLTGAFFCCQLLGRVMADEGGGVMVNIASTAGHPNPLTDGAAYVASKSGLIGLTRQCAREYAASGIRVNAICPGNILESVSPMTPAADAVDAPPPQNAQKRYGMVEDIADVALFLCSDAARFITGQAINVDGGESMV